MTNPMTPVAPAKPKHKPAIVPKPTVRSSIVASAKAVHPVPAKPAVKHAAKLVAAPKSAGGRYIEAVGRRKTAVVRVRLHDESGSVKPGITVNDRPFAAYFPIERHQHIATAPLTGASLSPAEVRVTAHAAGGGVQAQAEALSLGLTRALVKKEKGWRPRLKALGLLTRDPRMVEKKKFGSRKARRPQQWRKR